MQTSLTEFSKKDPYLDWTIDRDFSNCKEILGINSFDFFIPFLVELNCSFRDFVFPVGCIGSTQNSLDSAFGVIYCRPENVDALLGVVKSIAISLPVREIASNTYTAEANSCETIYGVVDFGGSVLHPAIFGSIECFWDMLHHPSWDNHADYGSIASKSYLSRLNRQNIQDAYLQNGFMGDNGSPLGQHKNDHCTKVLSLLLNKNREGEKAVVVSLPRYKHQLKSNLSSDAHIVNAINFIVNTAKQINPNAKCIINISAGINGGRKDGSSVLERCISDILERNPHLKICVAAGNERLTKQSLLKVLKAKASFNFKLRTHINHISDSAIEIHSFGIANLKITLPSGKVHELKKSKMTITENGMLVATIKRKTVNDGYVFVANFMGLKPYTWTFTLINEERTSTQIDVHIQSEHTTPSTHKFKPQLVCTDTNLFASANTLNLLASAKGVVIATSTLPSGKLAKYASTHGASTIANENLVLAAQVESDSINTGLPVIGVLPGQFTQFTGTSAAAPLVCRLLAA